MVEMQFYIEISTQQTIYKQFTNRFSVGNFLKIVCNVPVIVIVPSGDKAQRHITRGTLHWHLDVAVPALTDVN